MRQVVFGDALVSEKLRALLLVLLLLALLLLREEGVLSLVVFGGALVSAELAALLRQYLYFCTSKASKLSTIMRCRFVILRSIAHTECARKASAITPT